LIQINDLSGQTCRIDPLATHPREDRRALVMFAGKKSCARLLT
jgi:hypothetical protein